ncbi:MAG: phosphatase PAP2 family protein [Proteobacteria bacterium]|nr:phosphatase PAP2 family protein [Pseudomonadota bacterium]
MRPLIPFVVLLSIWLAASSAWAESHRAPNPEITDKEPAGRMVLDLEGPVYKLDLKIDVPVLVVGGLISLGWLFRGELGPADCAPLCDDDNVNGFDKFSAGYYNEPWALTSDIAVAATLALGVAAVFIDNPSVSAFSDLLVVAESVLLTNALITIAKFSVRRPRPYLYSEKAPESKRMSAEASLSFPSLHVGTASALTTSVFGVLYARQPKSPWTWAFLGVGTAATGVIAAGRILSGSHFLSDVLVGASIGVCTGILVPALHKKNMQVVPTVTDNSAGLAITGKF